MTQDIEQVLIARLLVEPPRVPDCHPDRKHLAKGLCSMCYQKSRARARGVQARPHVRVPDCHPDRKHLARGLCKPCYDRARLGDDFTPRWGKPRMAECHPDRRHYSHGLCEKCDAQKRGADWYAANRERRTVASAIWKADNRDRVSATNAAWYSSNKERVYAYAAARRARRRGNGVAPYNRLDIFERDLWTCQLCGGAVDRDIHKTDPMRASIDHIVPIVLGGSDTPSNVHLAHLRCNKVKGARVVA